MDSVNSDPFRTKVLPVTTGKNDIDKLINTPVTCVEIGKALSSDTNFFILLPAGSAGLEVEEAKRQVQETRGRFQNSLCWLWENNPTDVLALAAIKAGDTEKAIATWKNVIYQKDKRKLISTVLIEDLITYADNWPMGNVENTTLEKVGEEYLINRQKQTGASLPAVFADLDYEGHWTIEVDTQWILGGVDKFSYGIIFGREQNNYYSFVITANGYFSLVKQTNGEYNELIPWKRSLAINQRSINQLLIKKIDSQFGLYVNYSPVASFEAAEFFGKNFGFKVWGNQKVSFKNFKFSRLVEELPELKVTEHNYSCIKNLSVLYLGLAIKNGSFNPDYLKKGIELAAYFFASEQIGNYAKLIDGGEYVYDPVKTPYFYIDKVIDLLRSHLNKPGGISGSELMSLFSNFPGEVTPYFQYKFAEKEIQHIDVEIAIAKDTAKRSVADAAIAGKKLADNTREDIEVLKIKLGENDAQYSVIADKLSNEIVQCGVAFYSYLFNTDHKLANSNIEAYLPEHEYAWSIAATDKAKDKAKGILDIYQKLINESSDKKPAKRITEEVGVQITSAPKLFLYHGIGTVIYGQTLYFMIFGIPLLPLSRYNCKKQYQQYIFYSKLKLRYWQILWKYGLIALVCGLLTWLGINIFYNYFH
jgi:hypothetical protein